jgi:hypothetical protein
MNPVSACMTSTVTGHSQSRDRCPSRRGAVAGRDSTLQPAQPRGNPCTTVTRDNVV